MKKLLMAIAGAAILTLAACGGKPAEPAPETPAAPETPGAGAETETPAEPEGAPGEAEAEGETGENVTYDAAAAEASYKSCAGCHGGNLEGVSGPALKGTGLSADEILDIIENGKGTMPPGLKTGDEAKNLAAWIAEQ